MGLIAGIVFDMDDTLYLERDYVVSGFRFIAERLADIQIDVCAAKILAFLLREFEEGRRGDTFDRLLAAHPSLAKRVSVPTLIEAYRRHSPCIGLLPDVLPTLHALRNRGIRVGLLSDGPLACQHLKWRALGLQDQLMPALFTDAWGRDYWKPHPRGFEEIAEQWAIPDEQMVYVGDNPSKDFDAPRRRGWLAVRLRVAGQLHYEKEAPSPDIAPHFEIGGLIELLEREETNAGRIHNDRVARMA